jgi:hypothetical protein
MFEKHQTCTLVYHNDLELDRELFKIGTVRFAASGVCNRKKSRLVYQAGFFKLAYGEGGSQKRRTKGTLTHANRISAVR